MALFEIDGDQFEQLTNSIGQLSENLAKWQARQTEVIQLGFSGLIAAVTGADVAEIQLRIDALTQEAKTEADALTQTAQTNQSSNEGD